MKSTILNKSVLLSLALSLMPMQTVLRRLFLERVGISESIVYRLRRAGTILYAYMSPNRLSSMVHGNSLVLSLLTSTVKK